MTEGYRRYQAMVEAALPGLLIHGEPPEQLLEAMRYSLMAGGKRLRPVMMLAMADMLGGDVEMAVAPACAVEMIHTYSLIHDDLPGMDNDVMRRGKPTNHVVYGVGQAILAGDGLLSHAFEIMLTNALAYPAQIERHVKAMREIAKAAGIGGMVGGQCVDLLCELGEVVCDKPPEQLLDYIHRRKTGALIRAPLIAGALLCGADEARLAAAGAYGDWLGALFQASDDLLDVEGDAGKLGKSVGKDQRTGKLTSVSLYGVKGTRARIESFAEEALSALEIFGEAAVFFRDLTRSLASRRV